MSIITKMLKQAAVYWPLIAISYDQYGQPQWDSPVEINCRWEDTTEEFIAKDGTLQKCRSKVFVDRDLQLGGMLMLGELDSSVNEADPKQNDLAYEIKSFAKVPNLRVKEFLRTVYL